MNFQDLYNRALVRSDLGELKAALSDWNQLLRVNPTAAGYYNRGVVQARIGDTQTSPGQYRRAKQSAIADYTQALQHDPRYLEAYYNRGLTRDQLADKRGAIKDYTQALRIDPSFTDAYNNRGLACAGLGCQRGAIKDYSRAIAINPSFAGAYLNRGNAWAQLGSYSKAIKEFDQALGIDPNFAEVYGNRGKLRSKLGDQPGAIADYQKAAELFFDRGNINNYQIIVDLFRALGTH